MKSINKLTAVYSVVQAFYWMSFCIAYGFAAVFLQGLGYSNIELGIIVAVGNILGTLLGTVISSHLDRHVNLFPSRASYPVMLCMLVAVILLILSPDKSLFTAAAYVLYISLCVALNSVLLKVYVDFEYNGAGVNFSFGRGIGSLAYVVISAVLGVLCEKSVRAIPYSAGIVILLMLVSMYLMDRYAIKNGLENKKISSEAAEETSVIQLFTENPLYLMFLAGNAFVFFTQKTMGTFLVNLVRDVGGTTTTVGYITAFTAAVEVPVMLFYKKFRRFNKKGLLIIIAFIFFSVKNLLVTVAGTTFMLFVAFAFQAPSYALYSGAVVDYVDEVIPYKDSAKGQSLAFSMNTVGAVLSCFISGALFDKYGVMTTKSVALASVILGSAITICSVVLQYRAIEKAKLAKQNIFSH